MEIKLMSEMYDSGKLKKSLKEPVRIILDAVNDWPLDIISLEQYEKELANLIGKDAEKTDLAGYLTQVNYSRYAWEAESITQLLDIYKHFDEKKTLKNVFQKIRDELI